MYPFFFKGSQDQVVVWTRKKIFSILRNCMSSEFDSQLESLEHELSREADCPVQIQSTARSQLSKLFFKMRTKWKEARGNDKFFDEKNENWLNVDFSFPVRTIDQSEDYGAGNLSSKDCSSNESRTTPGHSRGRPSLDFATSSDRSKRRKTEELRKKYTPAQLLQATTLNFRSSGNLDSAKVIQDVTASPTRATRYRAAFAKTSNAQQTISADEALSDIVEGKLTRHQYNVIRKRLKTVNCKVYPSYDSVQVAKKLCYPPPSSITVTETSADIKLQGLLDHTSERLLLSRRDFLKSLNTQRITAELICKWGCDGSSGQSEYKQSFSDDSASDAHIFLTSFVPLRLAFSNSESDESTNEVIWENPRPSSPRFCRPIRLQFVHETTEVTVNEKKYIDDQIVLLEPFTMVVDGSVITINYKMLFTMIDGKVCNAVTSTTSTLRCNLCSATSKDFNDIDKMLKLPLIESNLSYGMSTLHAWIRMFECLLHISYKLHLKKWQARTESEKTSVKQRKSTIQNELRSSLGLVVDRPKPGYGSSNDGNTARRFFENSPKVSLITGVNERLMERFHAILQVISSGRNIDVEKYKEYALETARMYVAEYPWYNMPTAVHKLLMHGSQIIASASLPIGQLSEEAQEARNKDIKKYREGFSRKCSRERTMQDVLNWLLVSSDPYISSLRELPAKKHKKLSNDALRLISCSDAEDDSAGELSISESEEYDSD